MSCVYSHFSCSPNCTFVLQLIQAVNRTHSPFVFRRVKSRQSKNNFSGDRDGFELRKTRDSRLIRQKVPLPRQQAYGLCNFCIDFYPSQTLPHHHPPPSPPPTLPTLPPGAQSLADSVPRSSVSPAFPLTSPRRENHPVY